MVRSSKLYRKSWTYLLGKANEEAGLPDMFGGLYTYFVMKPWMIRPLTAPFFSQHRCERTRQSSLAAGPLSTQACSTKMTGRAGLSDTSTVTNGTGRYLVGRAPSPGSCGSVRRLVTGNIRFCGREGGSRRAAFRRSSVDPFPSYPPFSAVSRKILIFSIPKICNPLSDYLE